MWAGNGTDGPVQSWLEYHYSAFNLMIVEMDDK